MNIKLKGNQKRENLIFSVKALTDAYDCEMGDTVFYYIQDINVATAQNSHNKLVQALRGLEATQEANDLQKLVYRLLGQVDMEKEVL